MIRQTSTPQTSVIGSSLTVIAPALSHYGLNAQDVFLRHGFELDLASQPTYRIPVSRTASLWADAARAAGDDAFGLRAGACAHPTMYHSLGMALWSSSSPRQLIESWIRYLSLISTAAVAKLSDKGDHYEFTGHSTINDLGNSEAGDIAIDAALAALITICRQHGSASFSPLSAELMRAAPFTPGDFERFFSCPVEYRAPLITLRFDKDEMNTPIAQGNPVLMQEMEKLSLEYIIRMGDQDLMGKLRKTFLEQLPNGGADQERVASALHMSARTLHRKLRDEGTSYRKQLDEVRCELSLQYMAHEKLSILDIAFQLGFSNCSNFARAFKRWVGKSPNEYRASATTGRSSMVS
jgi:AraC-like DNA-binding protein